MYKTSSIFNLLSYFKMPSYSSNIIAYLIRAFFVFILIIYIICVLHLAYYFEDIQGTKPASTIIHRSKLSLHNLTIIPIIDLNISKIKTLNSNQPKKSSNTSERNESIINYDGQKSLGEPTIKMLDIEKLNFYRGSRYKEITLKKKAIDIGQIEVCMATGHFFSANYGGSINNCPWREHNEYLNCVFRSDQGRTCHALWVHGPSYSEVARVYPTQKKIIMTLESLAYYTIMRDPNIMSSFDYRMTYHLNATVPCLYSGEWVTGIFKPPLRFNQKINAVAYLNRNCGALSKRADIIRELINLKKYPVHSFGGCDHNMEMPIDVQNNKVKLFGRYKFCVAMENSVETDYVSEKLWQALTAGCIPIYLGAPNIQDFLPARLDKVLLHYPDIKSVELLNTMLETLSANETLYNDMLAWKHLTFEQMMPSFQFLMKQSKLVSPECLMCQRLGLDIEAGSIIRPV